MAQGKWRSVPRILDSMDCFNCNHYIGEMGQQDASISILVLGDEYIYSYFRCPACEMYAAEQYHDRFMGDSEIALMKPIPKEEGEEIVALIKRCPRPSDKFCECESHKALYSGRL
jgi:hypothetical protein